MNSQPLAGIQLLVVGDQRLDGSATGSIIQKLGARIIGPAAQVEAAARLPKHEPVGGVAPDIRVGNEAAMDFVDKLRKWAVLILLTSDHESHGVSRAPSDVARARTSDDPALLAQSLYQTFAGGSTRKDGLPIDVRAQIIAARYTRSVHGKE
jgi:hypothetical protein